jgi:DNA-binding LacI/PurR family transcriptional regulator
VAKKAGLGVSTVSRYLTKKGYVSKEAKIKIEEAIEELNFYPNAIAQSIRSKKTNTIAFLIPSLSNQFFPQLATFIENYSFNSGYKMILCNTNEDIIREEKYVDMIIQNRIDGVISATGKISQRIIDKEIPIVSLDRVNDEPNDFVVSVTANHYLGGKQAANHLVDCGCKKLLDLYGPLEFEPMYLRKKGFLEEATKRNASVDAVPFHSDYDVLKIAKEYDGVFVWNDLSAVTFITKCLENGISIPDDLQIIGYDDIELLQYVYPKITTISQPMSELANEAFKMILKMITTKEKLSKNIILDTDLVVRDTTKGI